MRKNLLLKLVGVVLTLLFGFSGAYAFTLPVPCQVPGIEYPLGCSDGGGGGGGGSAPSGTIFNERISYSSSGEATGPGPDAGDTLATAKKDIGAIYGETYIHGTLVTSQNDLVDIYQFDWAVGPFYVETRNSTFDTILFLFDHAGSGLFMNDDFDSTGWHSAISIEIFDPGTYYLAIASLYNFSNNVYGLYPVSENGLIFPELPEPWDGLHGATGAGFDRPLSGWNTGAAPDGYSFVTDPTPADYEIHFVAVPEPSTLLLLGFGLMWIASFGRKKFA